MAVEEEWKADRMILYETNEDGEPTAALSAEYPVSVRR